ncbi:hypothetical protein GCM10010420_26060 [Streptomyces glaucosporus]|uniref:Secreted protein n=1 Tax=Streptomyces glaucosporus TaxID=284044 RepID=A0ABP5VBD3_9ACTN
MTGGIIAIAVVFIIVGGVTAMVVAYFRLQRHRADAVAMASYRKLAEDVITRQEALQGRLDELGDRLRDVENLLRSVD